MITLCNTWTYEHEKLITLRVLFLARNLWYQAKKLAVSSMIFPFSHYETRVSTFPAHSPFSSLSLPVWVNAKSIGENRSLAPLPPLLLQSSLLTVTISRWNCRHSVSNRFVDSVVLIPCPSFLISQKPRIVNKNIKSIIHSNKDYS